MKNTLSAIIKLFPNFTKANTGGGCKAYHHDLEKHRYILITDLSGTELPKDKDTYVLAGQYDDDGWMEYPQGGARIPVKRLEAWLDKRIMGSSRKRPSKRRSPRR